MELIVSYGAEGTIQAWTLRGGTVLRTWRGLGANVMNSSNACVMQPVTDRLDAHPMLAVDNKILAWNWDSESIATRSVVTMSAEHALKVTALHASPLGRYIVAGFDDGSIRAWSVVDGALVLTLIGAHRRAVQCIRMSPRERWLATGGADATVHVWDWSRALCSQNESARHVTLSAHRLAVTGVTWTSESKLLSISTDGTCRVWDVLSRHMLFAVTFSTPLTALAVSPTGHCAYVGGEDGVIYRLGLWDPPARDFQIETARDDNCYRGHKQRVTSLTTSMDGSHVISTSADHTCLVWYENSFQIAHSFTRHMGPVLHAAVVLKLDAREEEHRSKKRAGLKMLGKISKEDESANDTSQQVTRRVMSLSDTKHEVIDTLWHQDSSTVLGTTDLDAEPVTWTEELFHERVRAVRRPASVGTSDNSSEHVTAENSRLREEVKQLKEINRKWKHVSQGLWSQYADSVAHNL